MKRNENFNVVDLFCGAGGMSEGFKMAGYNILLGIEADKAAAETYQKNNISAKVIIKDIKKISKKEILDKLEGKKVDVVVGGPPCQGFSMANSHRKPDDPRNELYLEFVRIVKMLRPRFFVMENVRGFLNVKINNKGIVEELNQLLNEYNVDGKVLTAADFGVPQVRRRAFIIGRRGAGKIPFPEATYARDGKDSNGKMIKEWKAVKTVLFPKREVDASLFYSKRRIRGFKRREKRNKNNGVGFRWQFLDIKKPSYTIPARYYKDGANALVKYSDTEIRMLDVRECARIQSFPNNYIFASGKIQTYRQVGNAVPPVMAKMIAKSVKRCLNDK